MTTMRSRDLDPVAAAVNATLGQVGPGLHGVACSGGADSLALAHAAIAVAGPAHVVVIAIDHGLQPVTARVAAEVAAWAIGQGAVGIVRRVHVDERASIEAAARDARYAAFADIADELGLASIMLGHTARDQVETVMMRIVRGTGPAGLAGIPARRGLYHRPLLALPRSAIDAYVRTHALVAWDDPMNHDRTVARVRMRDAILPTLRAENPNLDAALVRLATSAAEWSEVIDALARPFTLPIHCPSLAAQPTAVRKRALSIALDERGIEHDATHLDAIDALVTASTRGTRSLDLPGVTITRTYDELAVESGAAARDVPPFGAGLVLRTYAPGDRMRPARLRGRSRKLSDLFIDAKVPRILRASARVLVHEESGEIVWAEHLGLAHGAPATLVAKPR